jgi:zinc protease
MPAKPGDSGREDNVIQKTLPNGLRVLFKQDRSTPIVAVNVWFGVGSVNESEEMNGLAHFQEHMVFKGTEKYGVGEIANLVKSYGGNLNAGTSYSYTMYYIVLPARAFTQALEIQSDAMMHSTFDPEEFQKERLVVIDEARMYDDRPESYTFYRTMELGFQKHNYRRPIAGYQPIVEKITREQLLEFYNNYYRPTNAVLVVVGDVEPDDALARIEKVYGGWDPGEVRIGESPAEPPQESFRFRVHTGTMDHGYLGAGFHVPSILHEDYPALEMLSELLSAGRSSRLYRKVLEEKRLVTSVSASLLAERWPGFFLFMASMPPDKWSDATSAIFEEVERFKHTPVGEDELEKARRQIEKGMYSELESMEGQASNLGYYALLGDYRLADEHREAIKKVTPEKLMAAAGKYFHPDNCSLVGYLPGDNGSISLDPVEAETGIRKVLSSAGGITDMNSGRFARVEARPDDAATAVMSRSTEEARVELFALSNGVRVLLKKRTTVPVVSMLTVFGGGARLDPAGKSGLSTLAHRVVSKETRSYNAEEIVRTVEGAGGSLESYANFDTSGIYVNVLSAFLDEVLPVYREVVREPAFRSDRVTQERTKLLEEMAKRRDVPVQYAMDRLFKKSFGDHPYSYPFAGDPDVVGGFTADDCGDWYRRMLTPSNVVVAFVGDISRERAEQVAGELYGDLPAGEVPEPDIAAGELPVEPGEHTLYRKDLKQAVTLVGFTAPPMMTPEAIALEVLNGALTGLGGRLFVELRDKRSLGYMTGSSFSSLKERSIFFGYANPGAEGADEAFRVILHELEKVTREQITDDELTRSKEWLIGSQVMQLQRNFSQAIAYGALEALGFGWEAVDRMPERIQRVGKQEILDAAAAVFDPAQAVLIKLLPEETGT